MKIPLAVSSSLPTLRQGMVVWLFVISALLHLHMRVIKHFADANAPCPQLQQQQQNALLDLPEQKAQAQRQLLAKQQQQQQQLQDKKAVKSSTAASTVSKQLQPQQPPPSAPAGLHAPNSTMLPLANENGIIIFYMHIPKTGGTTMMAPFVHHPDWKYRMVFGFGKQMRYRQEMYDWLDNWQPNTKVYYEYHAGTASPYMDSQVREDLLVWKAMAKVRNIPFFAFTVVREPLSMAVSHFNFYYTGHKQDDNRYFHIPNPTEQDFMEIGVPNPQCLFCVQSELSYYKDWRDKGKSIESTPQACENVYQAFVNDFDWIGTTEGLSTETFPILEQLGDVRYCPEVRNKSKDKISKRTLSQTALDHVKKTTALDQSIYNRAQRDFPFDMWANFDHTPKPPPNPKKRCKYRTGQALPPGELPKRAGERRRFLEKNPNFVEAKGNGSNKNHLRPHYLGK